MLAFRILARHTVVEGPSPTHAGAVPLTSQTGVG